MLMVSTQTPAGELLKLPLLIEHFIKHQQQNGLSFLRFIEEHYTIDHRDADFPEDEQLPFKNITSYNIDYAVLPASFHTIASIPLFVDEKINYQDGYLPRLNLNSIFHPPRV